MSRDDSPPTRLVVALIGGSHLLNHAYFTLLPPIFGALRSDLAISASQSGLALGVVGTVVVALQLPFGYLSDRYSRSLVLACSLSVGTVGAALTAVVSGFPSLLVAAAVTGVGIAGHHPAHYPMLSAATDPEARGRAFSIHGFTGALGFALPFGAVGAATALGLDWRVAVGAIAALGAVYTLGTLWVLRRHVPQSVTRGPGTVTERPSLSSLPSRLRSGVTDLSGPILLLTLLWFLVSMANWGVQAYTAPLLTDAYGVEPGLANGVVAAMLVVGAVSILAGGVLSDRHGARVVVVGGLVALVALAAVLASGLLPVAAVLGVTLVLATTVKAGRPALSKLGDALSPDADLGTNFGILTVGISGGGAVAPPVFGALTDAASIQTVFWAIAGLAVVAVGFTFVVLAAGDPTTN